LAPWDSLPIFQLMALILHALRPVRTKAMGEYPFLSSPGWSRTCTCAVKLLHGLRELSVARIMQSPTRGMFSFFKVFTVEMHHQGCPQAGPGDNVGLNVKNLKKENMPRVGDCMILSTDNSLKPCKSFTAQVQVLDHPGELKKGYSPIAFVRTGRSACKMSAINWKIGKESNGAKQDNPTFLKANEMAEVVFEPLQPFVCAPFDTCEGLGRVALMEGSSVVMLGKAVAVEFKGDDEK